MIDEKKARKKAAAAALEALKIGQRMADGTIYFGSLRNRPLFTTPRNEIREADYYGQAHMARSLNQRKAHGHKDWDNPRKDELELLCANWKEARLSGDFSSAAALWSKSSIDAWDGWTQIPGERQRICPKNVGLQVRCIRRGFSAKK
jgi:hypothetical protein